MITINSDMRGLVVRYESPYQQHEALYLVSLPPFINKQGLVCSGVIELRFEGAGVRA